jgi:hypothetical protein
VCCDPNKLRVKQQKEYKIRSLMKENQELQGMLERSS